MKKGLLTSYVDGLKDTGSGESFWRIIRYFIPEFITALLLYAMPLWLDGYFIGHLKSTSTYGTLGATNMIIHLIIKLAEAFSVGTLVLSGRHNGQQNYAEVGKTLRDAFWVNVLLGAVVAGTLYIGAPLIYSWYVPAEMVPIGVPFLRLRAVGIFLMFAFLAFVGFLRGVKNTKSPMRIFIVGAIAFVFFDYALIFGKFGFPELGLQGSALAWVIQYLVMFIITLGYVLYNPRYRKYSISLFSVFRDKSQVVDLIHLSWPMIFDKASMALAYIWLVKMMKPLGACGVATFCVVKDMERFALVPAIAFAQVITVLVANGIGRQNWDGIKSNIKKTVLLASVTVGSILFVFAIYSHAIIHLFDRKGEFTGLAERIFPILSVLAFFDLLQLVLSGALRGVANVRVVMIARITVLTCYFIPVSYVLSRIHIQDVALKILLIYGSFYVGNALMTLVYIWRFRGERWKVRNNFRGLS